jgi:hypothetical protein
LPTAGSFTYDPSANPPFSSFTVAWNGMVFDLTASANSTWCPPTAELPNCVDRTAPAREFMFLTTAGATFPSVPCPEWNADTSGSPTFEFVQACFVTPSHPATVFIGGYAISGQANSPASASGTFSVTPFAEQPSAVPTAVPTLGPFSLILLAAALVWVALLTQRRIGSGFGDAPRT